jgi:hypothetical protein
MAFIFITTSMDITVVNNNNKKYLSNTNTSKV